MIPAALKNYGCGSLSVSLRRVVVVVVGGGGGGGGGGGCGGGDVGL